jgi:hypothetical protein
MDTGKRTTKAPRHFIYRGTCCLVVLFFFMRFVAYGNLPANLFRLPNNAS